VPFMANPRSPSYNERRDEQLPNSKITVCRLLREIAPCRNFIAAPSASERANERTNERTIDGTPIRNPTLGQITPLSARMSLAI